MYFWSSSLSFSSGTLMTEPSSSSSLTLPATVPRNLAVLWKLPLVSLQVRNLGALAARASSRFFFGFSAFASRRLVVFPHS